MTKETLFPSSLLHPSAVFFQTRHNHHRAKPETPKPGLEEAIKGKQKSQVNLRFLLRCIYEETYCKNYCINSVPRFYK